MGGRRNIKPSDYLFIYRICYKISQGNLFGGGWIQKPANNPNQSLRYS